MKEISGNLKNDMKELLRESAGLISGFIQKGLCTVRAIKDRWPEYGKDPEAALPPVLRNKKAARLMESAGPTVTILEGSLGEHQKGEALPLLEANQMVRQLALQYQQSGEKPPALRVRIDYMAEGRADSYILPVKLEEKGDLLDHMQAWVDHYRTDPKLVMQLFDNAPARHQDRLKELLAPVFRDSLNDLSTKVVQHLRRHCEISSLEQHLLGQARAMPKRAQHDFVKSIRESIGALRREANTQMLMGCDKPQRAAPVQNNVQKLPRQSVRVQLRQNQAKQAVKASVHKVRPAPQR